MALLLEEELSLGIPVLGEIRHGDVVTNNGKTVLVDIGAKSEAVVMSAELAKMDQVTRKELELGRNVPVFIVNPENKHGDIIVSYLRALEELDWQLAESLLATEDVHEGRVIGFNKGGLLTRVGRVRGFIPTSQLANMRGLKTGADGVNPLQKFVGKFVSAKVIEVDRSRNRLILSERAASKEVRAAKRAELLSSIAAGDTISGTVVNVVAFGTFIDIGGMEGLVHISEYSWKKNINPKEKFKVGTEIEVFVLSIDEKKQRIALSTKRLEKDPWTMVTDRYHVGQLVAVKITKLTDYGAFARIQDDEYDFEGLIHVSEIADSHIKHASQIVKSGEEMTARVIRLAPEKKQIGLSIKQVASDEYMEADLAWAEANQGNFEEE